MLKSILRKITAFTKAFINGTLDLAQIWAKLFIPKGSINLDQPITLIDIPYN